MIILEDYWSPGKVIDYYYDSLSKADIAYLENSANQFSQGAIDSMGNVDERYGFINTNMLSEEVVALKPSGIRKFFDIVSEMKDAISLGVGEPDFDTPWFIRDEGIYSLEKGRTFYTSNAGLKELKMEICTYLHRKYQCNYHLIQVL